MDLGWRLWILLAAIGLLSCGTGGTASKTSTAEPTPPRLLDGLGDHHHEITTGSPLAQRYFDQGMVLAFGFNHEAAGRSFAEARRVDPACAMCAWGQALVLGPNINAPMGPDAALRAHALVEEAERLAPGVSPRERAYIAALATRYAADPAADRGSLDLAYAEAMAAVHRADPEDDDAATLYAEALMDLMPWNYWEDADRPREATLEALALLEGVLERNPGHVGANHYYIHAVEEYHPDRAVAAADRLGSLAPEAGHLVHMPSHIFWRVGRYDDALEINRLASAADEAFFAWCRAGTFYRAAYYPHNLHFMWAAASASGRKGEALTAARRLEAATADGVDQFDFLEEFLSIPNLTLVRFGQWDALLGAPAPDPQRRYLTGIWFYVRGIAFVRTERLDEAAAELTALQSVKAEPPMAELVLSGGVTTAAALLGIAADHLEGELAGARGDTAAAVGALERAVAAQDAISYMEPPPWYFPTRQALGALLLEAGAAEDAEAVYRTDLSQYPANGWSLFGLAMSLEAQGRSEEASWARDGFANAWAGADVELTASRF